MNTSDKILEAIRALVIEYIPACKWKIGQKVSVYRGGRRKGREPAYFIARVATGVDPVPLGIAILDMLELPHGVVPIWKSSTRDVRAVVLLANGRLSPTKFANVKAIDRGIVSLAEIIVEFKLPKKRKSTHPGPQALAWR